MGSLILTHVETYWLAQYLGWGWNWLPLSLGQGVSIPLKPNNVLCWVTQELGWDPAKVVDGDPASYHLSTYVHQTLTLPLPQNASSTPQCPSSFHWPDSNGMNLPLPIGMEAKSGFSGLAYACALALLTQEKLQMCSMLCLWHSQASVWDLHWPSTTLGLHS